MKTSKNIVALSIVVLGLLGSFSAIGCDMGTYNSRFQERQQKTGSSGPYDSMPEDEEEGETN